MWNTFVVDGSVLVVAQGPDGLAYFFEHISATTTFTNRANGKTVTIEGTGINKDLRVTDNGDGTLTILNLRTGNDVYYGPDGNVIGRNPGQIRIRDPRRATAARRPIRPTTCFLPKSW